MEIILKNKLEKTFKKERISLFKFIKSKISDFQEAEDILQDVFVQAVLNINIMDSIENLSGWLYAVANNRIIDWYRKKKLNYISIDKNVNDITLEELIYDSGINLEIENIKSIVMEEIIEAIDELPEKQKDIFIKQVLEGKTFKEISEAENVSINTLLARKKYAVNYLRKRLEKIKDFLNEI